MQEASPHMAFSTGLKVLHLAQIIIMFKINVTISTFKAWKLLARPPRIIVNYDQEPMSRSMLLNYISVMAFS